MEQNIDVYCKIDKCKRKNCCCIWIITAIIAVVLAFFIGLLVSAVTGILAALGTPVLIAFVVLLAIILIISIIALICCKNSGTKNICC